MSMYSEHPEVFDIATAQGWTDDIILMLALNFMNNRSAGEPTEAYDDFVRHLKACQNEENEATDELRSRPLVPTDCLEEGLEEEKPGGSSSG